MDGIHKKEAEFIFNKHSTDGSKGTVITDVIIRRVIMLVIIMTGDGNTKGRKWEEYGSHGVLEVMMSLGKEGSSKSL